ncbi:unnamed protein product, partial [Symbiodinium necroappetens]
CDGTSASSTSSRGRHDHGHKLGRFSQVGGLRNLRGGAAQRELSQQVKRQLAQCQVGQILKVADHCAEHMTLDGAVAALQTLARDPEFKANGKDRRISSILDIYRKSLVPGRRLDMKQLTTSCWAFARLQVRWSSPCCVARCCGRESTGHVVAGVVFNGLGVCKAGACGSGDAFEFARCRESTGGTTPQRNQRTAHAASCGQRPILGSDSDG